MMTTTIIPRKSKQRGHVKVDWLDSYHTFSFGEYHDPANHYFGALRVINEDIINPDTGFGTHPHNDMEILTLVLSGELQHKDDLGNGSVIKAGDVQRMTAGTGIRHSEVNPSLDAPVHLYQIWILPQEKNLAPGYEQKHFNLEDALNQWQLLASPYGHDGSVTIHQDAYVYQTHLGAGQTLSQSFADERMLWLQVANGSIKLEGETYTTGDGIGIVDMDNFKVAALEDSHLILFDLKKARYVVAS